MTNNFGGLDFGKLFGNAQKMQEQMESVKRELGDLRVTGDAGGGIVRITMDGQRRVLRVEIDDSATADKPMLEDLIAAATTDALDKVEKEINQKMQSSLMSTLGGIL